MTILHFYKSSDKTSIQVWPRLGRSQVRPYSTFPHLLSGEQSLSFFLSNHHPPNHHGQPAFPTCCQVSKVTEKKNPLSSSIHGQLIIIKSCQLNFPERNVLLPLRPTATVDGIVIRPLQLLKQVCKALSNSSLANSRTVGLF